MSGVLKGGLMVTAAVGLLALVGLATPDDAEARQPKKARKWVQPQASTLRLTLESGFGEPLRTFAHQGQSFVLGQQGDRYQIRVTNQSHRRVEAVVTVDGRDVITGQPGSTRSRGYIVPPRDSIVIEGFRRSTTRVAAFRFSSPGDSYSALKGTPENVGVIGGAFFEEKQQKKQVATRDEAERPRASAGGRKSKRARPAPRRWQPGEGKAESAPKEDGSNIGTGWGEDRQSEVTHVRFVRGSSQPTRVVQLRYDDLSGLRRRGINVGKTLQFAEPPKRGPQAFPQR